MYARLLRYLRPYLWPHFAAAIACMVLYSASSGIVPYLVRSLVDDVLARGDREMLRLVPGLIVLVFLVRGAVNFGQAYLGEWVGQHIVYDLRRDLDDKIQHLPVATFDRVASGTILSRITTDVLLVRQALTEGAAAMIRDATTVAVLVGVAFYLDFELAVVAFLVFPLIVLPLQRLSRKMRALSRRGLDSLGNLSALVQETILGNRVVKAFGMEAYEKQRFDVESRRLLKTYLRAARIKAFTTPMMEVLAAFGIAGVLWVGGESVIGGGRTTGGFIAFLSTLVLLYEPFKKLVRTNNIVQTGLGAARRIFDLLDMPGEPSQAGGVRINGLHDAIRFEHVSFAYGDEPVLHDACLEIRAGEVVALVGPSGGGKSTIADLIPRFYEVSAGRITLDGIDLRDIDLQSLRANIAVVTQFTFLFNDTVRANIAYGSLDRSQEEIEAAARAANAHEFILQLPNGYDTVVGELGVQLSGGQRQRIAIARALLKNAPILILDEATSALDAESERLVQRAIERLMAGRTTLVIAHRLSTIRRADRIVVVADGRIVESGTHEELLARGQLYKRLHDMQFEELGEEGGRAH
ncbi:MAG: lipid A export permease/ATP-binding protein MsbA [Candidatus Dadabacteria bacterium]|nr:MAG: lipid A export permease/ATP-binding protein MsbA [Candidatus Dadabacteria bacterium]